MSNSQNEIVDAEEEAFVKEHGHVGEIAVGTVLEYDDWQWAIVSEIDDDRDEPKLGFILLDELGDDVVERLEFALGCRQHYDAVKEYRDTEHEYWTSVDYVVNDDIFQALGPVHPDYRDGDSSE